MLAKLATIAQSNIYKVYVQLYQDFSLFYIDTVIGIDIL